jgi:hypothetical protein
MAVWTRRCKELELLCDDVVELDVQRRLRTKEILLSFLPRRRRVFIRMLEAVSPVGSHLEETRVGLDGFDSVLDNELQHLSRQSMAGQLMNRSSIMNRSRSTRLDLEEILVKTPPPHDMWKCKLLVEYQPVELKTTARSPWQPGVAATTLDGFVHLFLSDQNEGEPSIEDVALPVESVCLARCDPKVYADTVEFTPGGDSALHKVLGQRKISVRFKSVHHSKDWFRQHVEGTLAEF